MNLSKPVIWSNRHPQWTQILATSNHTLDEFPVLPQRLPLGNLPKGTRILPCLTSSRLQPHQFILSSDEEICTLNPVGDLPYLQSNQSKSIKSHVDWFEICTDLNAVYLGLQLLTSKLHHDTLVCVSSRGENEKTPAISTSLFSKNLAVPPVSQMQENSKIRKHICSPACVSMLLKYHGKNVPLSDLAKQCRDPQTGLFGIWPINMQAAAIEAVSACFYVASLKDIHDCIDHCIPIATSIKYNHGELPKAPLKKTAGHVLVIQGFQADHILVNDPAAADTESVSRRYNLPAFKRAWEKHHRMIYILASKT